jgi:hypothetical protein
MSENQTFMPKLNKTLKNPGFPSLKNSELSSGKASSTAELSKLLSRQGSK